MPVEMIGWIAPRISSEVVTPKRGHRSMPTSSRPPPVSARTTVIRANRLFLRRTRRLSDCRACRGRHRPAQLSTGASAWFRGADPGRAQAGYARPLNRRPARGAYHRRRQRCGPGQGWNFTDHAGRYRRVSEYIGVLRRTWTSPTLRPHRRLASEEGAYSDIRCRPDASTSRFTAAAGRMTPSEH